MDTYYYNYALCEKMNKVQLLILSGGHARVEKGWQGHVVSPAYSRLYYILDGEFSILSKEGDIFPLTKGNCYLIPAGYSFDYDCDSFMEQVYFHVKLCDFDGIDLLKHCARPLVYPLETATDYVALIHTSGIADSLKARQEICNSLFTFLEKYQITLEKNEYTLQVQNAIRYIDSRLSIQLSITEIAANVYAAPSTLTRNFKRETGMTIGQYIDSSVMFKAEQMLLSSPKSVLEISESLGFCDQFYFARRFKEKFGVAPRDYRRMNII